MFGRDTLYMLGLSMQILMLAIVTPAATRLLSASGFGSFTAATAVMQVLVSIECLGLNVVIQRVHSQDRHLARHVYGVAILLVCLFSAALLATASLWGPSLGFSKTIFDLRLAISWGGLAAITLTGLGLLRAADRLRTFVIVSALQTAGCQIVGFALLLTAGHGITEYLTGMLVGQLLACLVTLIAGRPALNYRRILPHLKPLLFLSVPLVFQAVSAYIYSTSDRLVIHSELAPVAVARYQVAYTLASGGLVVMSVLGSVWYARMVRVPDALRLHVLAKTRLNLLYLVGPTAIGLSLGTPVLLKYWVPSGYDAHGLIVVSCLVAASTVPYAVYTCDYQALLLGGLTKAIAVGCCLAALLNLGLNIPFVRILGINGSAGSTLVAFTFLAGWCAFVARRRCGTRILRLPEAIYCLAIAAAVALGAQLGISGAGEDIRWGVGGLCLVWLVTEGVPLVRRGDTRMVALLANEDAVPESVS
jgi:O-antigen/teichoic acid export membrane protein